MASLCISLLRSHRQKQLQLSSARESTENATLHCALGAVTVCKGDTTPRKHAFWTLLCHQRARSTKLPKKQRSQQLRPDPCHCNTMASFLSCLSSSQDHLGLL